MRTTPEDRAAWASRMVVPGAKGYDPQGTSVDALAVSLTLLAQDYADLERLILTRGGAT